MRPDFVKIAKKLKSKTLIDVLFVGMGTLEVKVLFARRGFLVEKVTRTGIGQIRLGKIPSGKFKVLKKSEVMALLTHPDLGLPKELLESQ